MAASSLLIFRNKWNFSLPSFKLQLEEEQNLARNTYLALNSQLLEELPTVTQHGYNIYRRCLSSFLYARKLFVGRTTKELLDLSEVVMLSGF